MRPLAPLPSPLDILQQIQERLRQGHALHEVIEAWLPLQAGEAVTWGRRLPVWEEYQGLVSPQAIGIARIVSRRALRAFGLALTEDGRIVKLVDFPVKPWQTPAPALTFTLDLGGEQLRVKYTPDCFPPGGQDYFYFLSPHEPSQPHCLSSSGYLSQYASHDAVAACGGPEGYAVLFAAARLRGEVKEFETLFEGKWPQAKAPRRSRKTRSPAAQQRPVVGEHTAAVLEERQDEQRPAPKTGQSTLFDELP